MADLIYRTWVMPGQRYKFDGQDGQFIKWALGFLGLDRARALAVTFWEQCDEWTRNECPHKARILKRDMDKYLLEPRYKELVKKFEAESGGAMNQKNVQELAVIADRVKAMP